MMCEENVCLVLCVLFFAQKLQNPLIFLCISVFVVFKNMFSIIFSLTYYNSQQNNRLEINWSRCVVVH